MKSKNNLITVIDIGTTKIICLIAVIDSTDNLKVIGQGHHYAQGFKGGSITDIRLAESSLLSAIEAAESIAGVNIEKAIININGNKTESIIIDSNIPVSGHPVTDNDLNKLIDHTFEQFDFEHQELVNYFPLEYSLDNEAGIKDPRLMFGDILSCKLHLITVASNVILNLANCLARCRVDIQDLVLSSYASSLSCLTKDEMELGATLIDIGGATTSIATFNGGNIIHSGIVMIGGNHITSDIAHGLSINTNDAERLKILHGNAINTSFNGYDMIEINSDPDEETDSEPNYIRNSELTDIIRPRVEEIFEFVKLHLQEAKVSKVLTKKIILTGGVSQLAGIKELASHMLNSHVRIGIPKSINGLTDNCRTPIFSASIGMLLYAHNKFLQEKYTIKDKDSGKFAALKKFFSWF
ncbi:MAG: cell division protein FtsA [Alphaproteobacteria bacterium]